ncbi:MAG: 2-oxo acid dehydrogenase subunit E2 [Algicola sp.]|nr:2-oxo acid dehydrogenase subunit E2 [Algicola sp.]
MSKLIDIILPADQLEGTSATLSKWLVAIGAMVKEGDPIIELETDKVSMEICAPSDGAISEIIAAEGEEVQVDTVLGRMGEVQDSASSTANTTNTSNINGEPNASATSEQAVAQDEPEDDSARHLVGPAVRRLLAEHSLDINLIDGTGRRGRVTRDDVRGYIANPKPRQQAAPIASTSPSPYASVERIARPLAGKMVPHTKMRKIIANHMVDSLMNTSPHVTSVFEMNMTNIIEHRRWHKKEFAELGVKLTFTTYFLAAMAKAAQLVPQTNARFHDDALEMFDDINIGVGTALGDSGLVVPVVQQVQEMNLFEIAKSLNAQTEKARNGKLKPSDMKNGTITISNHGVSGSLFAAPIIINQPEVAILGIGKLDKRVVVREVAGVDTMVIKPMCYVSLSIDHRALDAHQTNMFLAEFVRVIEAWGE